MEALAERKKLFQKAWVEPTLLLAFYFFIGLSSIRDLGVLSAFGFLVLILICSIIKPRAGIVLLLSIFYLPTYQLELPAPFFIATAIVAVMNLNRLVQRTGYIVNKRLLILYALFLGFRFISVLYVENSESFWSYFFTSLSVFVHLLVVVNLIEKKEDIYYILRMWGIIGALASILGYLHFSMQDSVYLRQIYVPGGDYDKSTIEGTYDFVRWIWAGVEPNFMGLQLLAPLVINISFLIEKKSIINLILVITSFLGILGTYSRTSFLIAVLVIFLFFVLSRRSFKSVFLFIILLFIGGFFLLNYLTDFVERIDSISEALNEEGGSGRFSLYKEALRNFFSNPIFGVGTGQTPYYSAYKLESHNLFLQSLGENGLFGFLLIIWIFGLYLIRSFQFRFVNNLFVIAGIAIFLNANTVSYFDLRTFFTLFVLLNYATYFEKIDVRINK